jgi:hypothetical protein
MEAPHRCVNASSGLALATRARVEALLGTGVAARAATP